MDMEQPMNETKQDGAASAVERRVMWQCEWCGAELTRVRGIAETSPGKKQAVGYCPKHGEIWSDEVAA